MWKQRLPGIAGLLVVLPLTSTALAQDRVVLSIPNHGGALEGHTPRGFRGMGTGLFAGDNLNPNFPNGDGVQFFLTFDLSALPVGSIENAELRSEHLQIAGDPFGSLGALRAETIRYAGFSPDLWDQATVAEACVLAEQAAPSVACDVTGAVADAVAAELPAAQFRLRLDEAGDGDGTPDLALFFISGSNVNEPGIFTLTVTVQPAAQ